MIYKHMQLEEVVNYINIELLKGRSMKDIEEKDFGVNERVITKRLGRKGVKKVDGQFVLQSGSKMTEIIPNKVIEPKKEIIKSNKSLILKDNTDFIGLTNRVELIEKALSEIICTQSSSKVVTNDLGLKIYSNNEKPVAKTIRLYKEIWDKIDKVKEQFPHINYQTLLNSLIDEITSKYLND